MKATSSTDISLDNIYSWWENVVVASSHTSSSSYASLTADTSSLGTFMWREATDSLSSTIANIAENNVYFPSFDIDTDTGLLQLTETYEQVDFNQGWFVSGD